MTTELDLALQDRGAIAPIPQPAAAVGTTAAAMEMLRNHAEMMAMAFELASAMVKTTMVPKMYQGRDKAETATAAILYGLELGLNPIQSLQQVFAVHGQPSIYARTMVALLKSQGYKFRTIEAGPKRVTVEGWWPGEDPEKCTWTIQRAIDAGFVPTLDPATGKYKTKKYEGYEKQIGNEKYLTQPEEMLWAKAASTLCRRLAPDALLGIARTVEDLESEPEPIRVRSERVTAPEVTPAEESDAPEVKVQQWQAPETALQQDEKPDIAQVGEPDPVPATVQPQTSAPETKPAPAQAKTTTRKVPTPPKVAPGGVTPEQLETISGLLDGLDVGQDDKRPYIEHFFSRPIADVRELTVSEGDELIAELIATATARQTPATGSVSTSEGGTA